MKYVYDIILMGISASIMYLTAQLLYKNVRKRYARWYYAMLITAVLMLVIPLQTVIRLPKIVSITVPETIGTGVAAPVSAAGITVLQMIFAVWFLITAAMLCHTAVKYFKTRRALIKISRQTEDIAVLNAYDKISKTMEINGNIDIRQSTDINSPLMFGIIKKMIIIPQRQFSENELEMIMAHELTHCKHHDLAIKLITSIGVCVHWYNPLAYMLSRSVNNACELCCDESVLDMLELEDKKTYGRLIISVIEASVNKNLCYTTAMAATERGIKRRLRKITEFKRPSRAARITGVMVLIAVCACSVTALGVDFAKKALPDEAVEMVKRIEDTPIISEAVSDPTQNPVSVQAVVPSGSQTVQPNGRSIQVGTGTISADKQTIISSEAQAPTATDFEPTPRPVQSVKEQANDPVEPERNSSVNIEINSSVNFNNEQITNDNKKQIEASAAKELKDGENVKAYIRINDDGSYDLMHVE